MRAIMGGGGRLYTVRPPGRLLTNDVEPAVFTLGLLYARTIMTRTPALQNSQSQEYGSPTLSTPEFDFSLGFNKRGYIPSQ